MRQPGAARLHQHGHQSMLAPTSSLFSYRMEVGLSAATTGHADFIAPQKTAQDSCSIPNKGHQKAKIPNKRECVIVKDCRTVSGTAVLKLALTPVHGIEEVDYLLHEVHE